MLRQQGKQEEAHLMLTKVHGWFTEGFETADLKAARVLLDEMSIATATSGSSTFAAM